MARPGPALFELLRDKTGTRSVAVAPPAAPTPAPAPAAPIRIPDPPRPAPRAPAAFDPKQRLSISMSTLWLALGGAILLTIIIYAAAFTHGRKSGEREVLKDLKGPGGTITEPLRSDPGIPVNPNLVSPAPKTSPLTGPPAATGPTPGAAGGDPRIAGYNYLTIASRMDKDTAQRACEFLTQNGVAAFAIPVAKSGSQANNPTYTVYALKGITRELLRARAPERTDLEEKVARLGKIWQKEHKGQTDFSKTYWDKFGS